METDQKKVFLAVGFLVLALCVLGFQIFGRIDRDARTGAVDADPGVMMDAIPASATEQFVAWAAPAGHGTHLEANPFLRPKGATRRAAPSGGGTGRASSRSAAKFSVTGVRTGPTPTVIINDRTRRVGDDIAGWRIVSIERDRVTVRSSDGRTIRLDAR